MVANLLDEMCVLDAKGNISTKKWTEMTDEEKTILYSELLLEINHLNKEINIYKDFLNKFSVIKGL